VLNGWLRHLYAALRGGTPGFSAAESRVLSFVLEGMAEPDRSTLTAQIGAVALVQRQHPGRLVVAYYRRPNTVPTLPYAGYEYCLAKVKYMSRGRARTTSLVLHDGRFMTFERNVPELERDIESLVAVEMHPGIQPTVADEIDHAEHASTAG
jgi:hypothetical protein